MSSERSQETHIDFQKLNTVEHRKAVVRETETTRYDTSSSALAGKG